MGTGSYDDIVSVCDQLIADAEAGTMVNDMLPLLNAGQRIIYDHIAHVIGLNVPINIYVSGSAGTGKSFLISLLQAKFRTINMSYVTCASTGIALIPYPHTTGIISRFSSHSQGFQALYTTHFPFISSLHNICSLTLPD